MSKPKPATHVFLLRVRREDPSSMAGAAAAQEAAIKALSDHGFEFSTGAVTIGSTTEAEGRIDRIAEAHTKGVGPGGLTSGLCSECSWNWPCPTYRWATEDRDPVVAPWDPSDDGGTNPTEGPR